jgi:hypothetical protein
MKKVLSGIAMASFYATTKLEIRETNQAGKSIENE